MIAWLPAHVDEAPVALTPAVMAAAAPSAGTADSAKAMLRTAQKAISDASHARRPAVFCQIVREAGIRAVLSCSVYPQPSASSSISTHGEHLLAAATLCHARPRLPSAAAEYTAAAPQPMAIYIASR